MGPPSGPWAPLYALQHLAYSNMEIRERDYAEMTAGFRLYEVSKGSCIEYPQSLR